MTQKAIVAVIVSVVLSLAGAQDVDAKPTRQEMKRAKVLFDKAEAKAADKDYVASAEFYLKAYELFPSSDFIFNAASMFRLAEDREKARKYFKEYLALDPKGRGASEALSAVARYNSEDKRELDRQKEEEERKAAAAKAKDKDKNKTNKDAALVKSKPGNSGDEGRSVGLPAIISVSAGGLLVGAGVYFALQSKSISDDVSASPMFDPALEDKGKKAARNAYIFGGIGAAAIVGGAVLYVLGSNKKSKEESLSFAPAINGDSVGAFAYGEF